MGRVKELVDERAPSLSQGIMDLARENTALELALQLNYLKSYTSLQNHDRAFADRMINQCAERFNIPLLSITAILDYPARG